MIDRTNGRRWGDNYAPFSWSSLWVGMVIGGLTVWAFVGVVV